MLDGMNKINLVSMNEDKFHYFYKDFNKRIVEREHLNNSGRDYQVKTGIKELDVILRGGPSSGQVWMFLGDAKSGKSLGLIHIGTQAIKRFDSVLHFQLEGKIEETLDRYDAAYSALKYNQVVKNQIPQEILDKMQRISERRNKRDLVIRGYTDWETCSILAIS